MANQNGRPIAPARKLVAAVVGTIAVFVMLFGLGMSSWAIVALGAAMLALAIGIGMVNVVRRGARAWVAGSAQVKMVSEPPATSIYGRAELQIVIVAPGLPTSEVTVRDPRVPVSKWPRVGDTLPVTVDVDDMRRVRINWDEAESRDGSLTAPPAYYDEDLPDDDLLGGEPEPPPWATRDRQWGRGPDEPPPPPPVPRSGDLDDAPPPSVIVRDAPGGPILEGQLVDPDYEYAPLPQRARTATATAPSRPADARPRPRPRPHATSTMDPEAPETPEPTAPAQRTAPPSAPSDAPTSGTADAPPTTRQDREIDLPLDGDPEPAPETTPAAQQAMASGIMAPPAGTSADDALLGDLEPPPWTVREQQRSAAGPAVADDPAPERPAAGRPQPGDAARTVGMGAGGLGAAVAAGVAALGNAFRTKKQPPEDHAASATAPKADEHRAAPTRPQPQQPPDSEAAAIDIPLGSADPAPTLSPGPIAGVFGAPLTGRAARPAATEPNDAPPATPPDAAAAGPAAAGPAADAAPSADTATSADVAPGSAAAGAGSDAPGRGSVAAPSAGSVTTWPAGDSSTARAPQAAAQPETPAGTVYGEAGRRGAAAGRATTPGAVRRGPWADLEGGFEPDERTDDLITAYPSARPSPASAIHGVGITVLVTNLERSVAFYREMLGFYEIDAGTGSAVLASGDTRLVLRKVHDLSAVAGRLIYLNLEVGDVEAVYEELKRKGAVFVHGPRPVNRGDKLELWAASFHDPDEHNIAITQWRAIR